MTSGDSTSHFWVGGIPFFTSTLFVVPPPYGTPLHGASGALPHAGASGALFHGGASGALSHGTAEARQNIFLEVYDVDGSRTNSVEVECPGTAVSVIELEPFLGGIKLEGGLQHGHLAVTTPVGARCVCRLASDGGVAFIQDPLPIRSRESCFIPITLATLRDQMLTLVNGGTEVAQVMCRLFYGNRSPEWTLVVPPLGTKIVSVHDELLADQDDRSWEKNPLQGYIRITPRHQSFVTCGVIERVPGESRELDHYRFLTAC